MTDARMSCKKQKGLRFVQDIVQIITKVFLNSFHNIFHLDTLNFIQKTFILIQWINFIRAVSCENQHFVYAKTKTQISFTAREADQRLCFRYIDRTILLLSKSKISSLYSSSVIAQPCLFGTWSETPKTGFLTTRLILHLNKIMRTASLK